MTCFSPGPGRGSVLVHQPVMVAGRAVPDLDEKLLGAGVAGEAQWLWLRACGPCCRSASSSLAGLRMDEGALGILRIVRSMGRWSQLPSQPLIDAAASGDVAVPPPGPLHMMSRASWFAPRGRQRGCGRRDSYSSTSPYRAKRLPSASPGGAVRSLARASPCQVLSSLCLHFPLVARVRPERTAREKVAATDARL